MLPGSKSADWEGRDRVESSQSVQTQRLSNQPDQISFNGDLCKDTECAYHDSLRVRTDVSRGPITEALDMKSMTFRSATGYTIQPDAVRLGEIHCNTSSCRRTGTKVCHIHRVDFGEQVNG